MIGASRRQTAATQLALNTHAIVESLNDHYGNRVIAAYQQDIQSQMQEAANKQIAQQLEATGAPEARTVSIQISDPRMNKAEFVFPTDILSIAYNQLERAKAAASATLPPTHYAVAAATALQTSIEHLVKIDGEWLKANKEKLVPWVALNQACEAHALGYLEGQARNNCMSSIISAQAKARELRRELSDALPAEQPNITQLGDAYESRLAACAACPFQSRRDEPTSPLVALIRRLSK